MNNTTVLANQSLAGILPSVGSAAGWYNAAKSAWSVVEPAVSLVVPGMIRSAANAWSYHTTNEWLQGRQTGAETAQGTEDSVTAASGIESDSRDSFQSAHSNADDETGRGTVCMNLPSQPPYATDCGTVLALNNEHEPVSYCLDPPAVSAQPQTSLPHTGNPSVIDARTQSTSTPQLGGTSVANSGPQSWLNTSVAAANHGTSVTGPHGCDGQSGFHIESKDLTRADVTITTYSPSGSAFTHALRMENL
ncbi:hypothetical protein DB88DRAFT_472933 [Papiliotrema laurentii]|uniref:Uncharacterized protein n=1 Tax=Papiliotrema laurentii TaxID=5418 RepID=A0AAD9CZP1_PAPLA|nr:hypothetical protein DB88DRAFT_472933 [Papiliotrema laurentii]